MPSQLVEQRPDVRAAEAQLHAATAEVGVAIANMLPQITLTRQHRQRRPTTRRSSAGTNEFWSAGASLTQTLFAGGTLYHASAPRAPVSTSPARSTGRRVLTAFQNVADALRALEADADAVQRQERAYQASMPAWRSPASNSGSARSAISRSINAQQSYQQAVIGRAQALMNRYADTAALYQALGGSAPEVPQKLR